MFPTDSVAIPRMKALGRTALAYLIICGFATPSVGLKNEQEPRISRMAADVRERIQSASSAISAVNFLPSGGGYSVDRRLPMARFAVVYSDDSL